MVVLHEQQTKEYPVRGATEYMGKAAEFERMARATRDPILQARFSNLAGSYRLLASEREWLTEIDIENERSAWLSGREEMSRRQPL
jgi:hypothetical protein